MSVQAFLAKFAVKSLSVNKWRVSQRQGKRVIGDGSVLFWYSTGAKTAFEAIFGRETLIYGQALIPQPKRDKERQYKRKVGGSRKPIESRKVFSAIVYVLRTGIQWKALPKEVFGSPSAIHRYFREWEQEGFFLELWQRGLSEYDDMEGIAWKWQSIDGSMNKAPLAKESSGRNPTDRAERARWDNKKRVAPMLIGANPL